MLHEMAASHAHFTGTRQPNRPVNPADLSLIPVDQQPAVFLVGGQDIAFAGLKTLLTRHGFDVAGVAARLGDLDPSISGIQARCLVIVDVADGVALPLEDILLFREDFPQACIVALVDDFQETIGRLKNNIGANAILDRNVACDALIKGLKVVMSGYGVLSPIVRSDAEPRAPGHLADAPKGTTTPASRTCVPSNLSDRELQIIACIAEGQSNKVIARRFSISEATVKIHVRGILRKVDARNRTQAAIWAIHRGFGSSNMPLD